MSVYTTQGAQIECVLQAVDSGNTATNRISIIDVSFGGTFLAPTSAGIVENPSGSAVYQWAGTAPATIGRWTIVWDDGTDAGVLAVEDLIVGSSPFAPWPAPGPAGDLLDANDLGRIALDMAELFTESATIQRPADSRDAIGGRTQAWSTAATTVCRVRAMGGDVDTTTSGASQDAEMYRVAFPVGTDLRLADRVVVNGLTLAVAGISTPTSLSLELVASCTRSAS